MATAYKALSCKPACSCTRRSSRCSPQVCRGTSGPQSPAAHWTSQWTSFSSVADRRTGVSAAGSDCRTPCCSLPGTADDAVPQDSDQTAAHLQMPIAAVGEVVAHSCGHGLQPGAEGWALPQESRRRILNPVSQRLEDPGRSKEEEEE